MRIVGIDLSMTSTGVAVISYLQNHPAIDVALHRIESAPTPVGARRGIKGQESLSQRGARLEEIVFQVERHVIAGSPSNTLVVIEGPSYSSKGSAFHQIAGCWWLTTQMVLQYGFPLVEVPPANRMKYATGKGLAPKDQVMLAAARRYNDLVEVTGNDVADALILAAMGARHLGHPLEDSLPKTHLAAMDNVDWSALEAR